MSIISWKQAKKRLQDIQDNSPKPIIVELTYFDNTTEMLSVEELVERDNSNWKSFRVVSGTKQSDVCSFLEWIAPFSVIGKEQNDKQ